MTDNSEIAIHIISRTGRNHWLLESWFRRTGILPDWIIAPYALAQGKNESAWRFLQGDERYLLQIDDDTVPDDETLPILDTSEDILLAYCAYPPRKSVEGVLCKVMSGCMRLHRALLESMPYGEPWFAPLLDPTGREQLETEERLVVEQCLSMGQEPVRVGYAGHLVEMVAKYRNGRTVFAWPHEVRG